MNPKDVYLILYLFVLDFIKLDDNFCRIVNILYLVLFMRLFL